MSCSFISVQLPSIEFITLNCTLKTGLDFKELACTYYNQRIPFQEGMLLFVGKVGKKTTTKQNLKGCGNKQVCYFL